MIMQKKKNCLTWGEKRRGGVKYVHCIASKVSVATKYEYDYNDTIIIMNNI